MHCIVVKRSTYAAHPFIAASLYRAFCEAKQIAVKHMRYIANPRYMLPWMLDDLDEIDEVFRGDPFPYGVEAGRHNLETFMQYMVEHGIITSALPVDDLFAHVGDSALT
jgi:4,5-dihydroxyphthalate decarboxylase